MTLAPTTYALKIASGALLIALALPALSAHAADWNTSGFKNVAVETISAKIHGFEREIRPTLVLLRESGWSRELALQKLDEAASILAPCGIGLGKTTLVTATHPEGQVSFYFDWSQHAEPLARLAPVDAKRPLVFLVKTRPESGFVAGTAYFSDPEAAPPALVPPALENTAFLARFNHSDYDSFKYHFLAHELSHLLAREGHNRLEQPNILHANARKGMTTNDILPEQCRAMRSHASLIHLKEK